MARKDFEALRAMGDSPAFADEIVGFHAQQAVEKALKAWLSALGASYPRTHNLGYLIALLEGLDAAAVSFRGVAELSVFGVQYRYEAFDDPDEESLDRDRIVREVEALLEAVEKAVGR